jgi:succinate-semialdehyde dehydrogenase/glutarate-semialdehyde dehydrogenase
MSRRTTMTMKSTNPFTGKVVSEVALWSKEELEDRLALTSRANNFWSKTKMSFRVQAVRDIAVSLTRRRTELAAMMTSEMGKVTAEALAEVDKCAAVCQFYADRGPGFIADETLYMEDDSIGVVTYAPIGTVLGVFPWNYPCWQLFRCLAPTLIAGNTLVFKGASNVPGVSALIQEIVDESGLEAGVFTSLRIPVSYIEGIIEDPRISYVTLTGSEFAGSKVAEVAGRSLKKTVLELGGSDPFIVLEDAHIDAAVAAGVTSRFQNAGQVCIAAKRFIVVNAVREEFTCKFVEAVSALKYGDPVDPETTLAPMNSQHARDEVFGIVRELDNGSNILIGGGKTGYAGMEATIIDNVSRDEKREIFGPVALMIRARDEDEAVEIANDSPYGLSSSVWTKDKRRGYSVAKRVESGAVFINSMSKSDFRLPFGGTKLSGYGRELGGLGMREMTNIRTVVIEDLKKKRR